MAKKNKSVKASLGGGIFKFRAFIFLILAIVLIIVGYAYLYYKREAAGGVQSQVSLTRTPGIASVPGEEVSPEFARKLQQENIRQAVKAAQTGTSALPTIVRPGFLGGSEFEEGVAKPGCTKRELLRAREAGVTAFELRCKGCTLRQLKEAGYTASELAAAGFSAADLRAAGFTAQDLKDAGFSASELRRAGFRADELAAAGYSASELNQAGYSPQELDAAGFTADQLVAAGVGVKPRKIDCNVSNLRRLRAEGVSAAEIRKAGCGAKAMRAAGFTAKELKDAGFSAAELRAAGFTAKELKDAGFTAGELRAAGFTAKELKDAGFSAAELRAGGFSAEDLKNAGFTADELRAAGYSDGDLIRAGFNKDELGLGVAAKEPEICSEALLKRARADNVSAKALRALGCDLKKLLAAGYTPQELLDAGLTPQELVAAGVDPAQIAQAQTQLAAKPAKVEEALSTDAYLSPEDRQDALQQLKDNMESQAGDLVSTWAPPPTQQYEEGEQPKQEQEAEEGTTSAPAGAGQQQGQAAGTAAKQVPAGTVVKAGTILFGVLDVGINSDEESPILARVVAGPLKGARLVGEFELKETKVVLNFNIMSIPQFPNSFPTKVVAIDPDTARTALASHVDNHYLLRFGTLFASSFLSGLADAISSSGAQTSSGAGGLLTTTDTLSSGEKFAVALGKVGTEYANVLGDNFTRKPTVTVKAGSSVGLLFMQDLTLPIIVDDKKAL